MGARFLHLACQGWGAIWMSVPVS